jgi:hypothetical protein
MTMDLTSREVTSVTRDPEGRTLSLCNAMAPWSPVPAALAIRQIRAGLRNYQTVVDGASSSITVVNGPTGDYLRTFPDRDAEASDNLDKLPDIEPLHPLAGGFDVVVQVDGPSIARAVKALHAAGVFPHRVNVSLPGRVGVLNIGAPDAELVTADPGDVSATAVVKTSFLLWSRAAGDTGDAGETSGGEVEIPVMCQVVADGDDALAVAVDWSGITPERVHVTTADGPADGERIQQAREMVLAWARDAGGRYPVPSLPSLGASIGLDLRFVAGSGAVAVAQAGIDIAPPLSHAFPSPTADPVRVVLSGPWIVRQVLDGLRAHWGGLPEPHGTTTIGLDGGASLIALDVELGEGSFKFVGRLVMGMTHAMFTVAIGITGPAPDAWSAAEPSDLQGTAWRTDGASVDVQVDDLLSRVGDFLSGGALRRAIGEGVRQAVAGGPGGGISGLLSRAVLGAMAGAGTAQPVDIEGRISEARLTPFGLVMAGDLVMGTPAEPIARLQVLPLKDDWHLLSALDSWSPGDRLTQVRFDFGDGDTLSLDGERLALAVPHRYAPGRWTARVTVVDAGGRRTSATADVTVPATTVPA